MERFLYRLSASPHGAKFILKGALLLRVWNSTTYRTTRDIDLLGRLSNDVSSVEAVMRALCGERVEPDGLEFDSESVRGESIVEDGEYHGVRVTFKGHLGSARADMQVDVGFGDLVIPSPRVIEYPVLLGHSVPRLAAYPPEATIAEKFEIMLKRGVANSRMKDYHDIWWLAHTRSFHGNDLVEAVKATCAQRGTSVIENSAALDDSFSREPAKMAQWRAFRGRLRPTNCPESLKDVVDSGRAFLAPIAGAITRGEKFPKAWAPMEGWK